MSAGADQTTGRDPPSDREQSLRAAAERVLGCWTIIERTNGVLGADGLRRAIQELTEVCDSYE